MSQTVLRIDDRLVHGQVLYGWGKLWPAEELWLVDDAVAADENERKLYEEPIQYVCRGGVIALEQVAELTRDLEGNRLLVTRDLEAAKHLLSSGVKVDQITLGNIASGQGREQFADHVFLSAEERGVLESIKKDGVEVVIRDLPSDTPRDPFLSPVKEGL